MKIKRIGWFFLFVTAGLLVFLPSITFTEQIPDDTETLIRTGLCIFFLLCALIFALRKKWNRFWPLSFAFFLAVFCQFLSWRFSGLSLRWLDLKTTTITGMAAAKLSQSLWIIIPILFLTIASGQSLASIYFRKGLLRYGLTIGFIGFFAFAGFLVWQVLGMNSGLDRLLSEAPWILIFVLSNGLNEELLFRGLFLKKFEPFAGKFGSVIVTAAVFAIAHMKVEYVATGEILMFLIIVFVLAVLWGYVMQKSKSIIGPALFHAGADLLLFTSLFTLSPQ
ncbi:MAG: CPBP family intramembrane metalloprotease [Candidatus Aminicenantes bacterium]|nr:CPBP family intramembrane metalloprotease [Candidatus Aminicenantes bacterium]